MIDIEKLRARHLTPENPAVAVNHLTPIANPNLLGVGTFRALLDELATLRLMKATIEADSVTCPLCEWRPIGPGWSCVASCRDGKVLQTTANVLLNVKLWLDEAERLRIEVNTLRLAQQWRGIESAPRDATKIDVLTQYGERFCDVWWSKEKSDWLHWAYDGFGMANIRLGEILTHWMPLPPAAQPLPGDAE